MSKKQPAPKVVFEEHIGCPHCKKGIVITRTKKVKKEAVKAEYDEKLEVKKDQQKKLHEVAK